MVPAAVPEGGKEQRTSHAFAQIFISLSNSGIKYDQGEIKTFNQL